MLPLLLAVLTAVLTRQAVPIFGFPLSMLRLAPDVNYTVTFAKLVIIAAVFVKSKKAPT